MKQQGIVGLTADFSDESPEIEQLMRDLGRAGNALPFYAVFPGDGQPPLTFDGVLTQGRLLDKLKEAGPSKTISVSQTTQSAAATN